MKKMLLPVMLFLLPTLVLAENIQDFPYTYKGEIILKDGEIIRYEKYISLKCDIEHLSMDTCLTTTRSQAKIACQIEGVSRIGDKPYVTRRCKVF